MAWLSASIQTLTALDTGADVLEHVKLRRSVDGKLVARVLPRDIYEELLFHGITADVWMRDGVTEQNLRENMASFYRREDPDGELALVLGAGNVSAIVPLDILDRMINCGEVVAHAHGLRFIVAPALNLSTVLNPGSREPRWRQFLDLNIVGPLARVADFVELQAQSLERDTATYTAFVQAATSQASAANPRTTVLAGLSTNPPGAPVDSHYLTAAIQATRSMVDGYWLNIPGQGARCPTCNAPRPDIAIQTLQALR